eukprot:GHVL01005070.1.p1 GENE.GHVL01005070.1~~GHVL01005070.1.p1  ORF type:complete len:552 (-),score=108.96 GHVL01005070.1:380-2035(-)
MSNLFIFLFSISSFFCFQNSKILEHSSNCNRQESVSKFLKNKNKDLALYKLGNDFWNFFPISILPPLIHIKKCMNNIQIQNIKNIGLFGVSDSAIIQGSLAILLYVTFCKTNDLDIEVEFLIKNKLLSGSLNDITKYPKLEVSTDFIIIINKFIHWLEMKINMKPLQVSQLPSSINKPVGVLVSGGVDSSVALMKSIETWGVSNVIPFFFIIHLKDRSCTANDDLLSCIQVCKDLNIYRQFQTINLVDEYADSVMSYIIESSKNGRTPNPDWQCNRKIKFGSTFVTVAKSILGKNLFKIVTGHYAQTGVTEYNQSNVSLFRGYDSKKDQSYFLSGVSQEQLKLMSFPVGHLNKSQVREIALKAGLSTATRKDSQGLCFLGKDVSWNDLMLSELGENPGCILLLPKNKIIGQHRGLWFYTYGQRRGIGEHLKNNHDGPFIVVGKDILNNILFVSYQNEALKPINNLEFRVTDISWINPPPMDESSNPIYLYVQLRYLLKPIRCEVILKQPNYETAHVRLLEPTCDCKIANGQLCAFYRDERECLGAGEQSRL